MSTLSFTHESGRITANAPKRFFTTADLVRLFFPLMIEQCLAFFIGLTDSVMVSSVGEAAVSGVSLVDLLMALLIGIFAALATGGSAIASQYMGRGDVHQARTTAEQTVWFVTLFSLVVMVGAFLLRPMILTSLFGQITDTVRGHADVYMLIVTSSIPFLGIYGAAATVFRTMGNAKLPMQISFFAGILNVIGNALMLFVFGYGTAGVALSTVFARVLAAVIIVALLHNRRLPLHLAKVFSLRMQWPTIRRMLGIGVPYGLENGLFYFGRILVLSLISTFGTAAIAANAVAGAIVIFEVLPGLAIGLGMTVVIARCVGAEDYAQARYYNRKILSIVYLSHIVVNAAVLLALPLILSLYRLSPDAEILAKRLVFWHAVLSVTVWPLAYTLPVTFRAAADAKFPMYVGFATMFACRIALAYILGGYLGMGVFGTWIAMFIDWIFKAGLFVWRYFSNRWTRFRAI